MSDRNQRKQAYTTRRALGTCITNMCVLCYLASWFSVLYGVFCFFCSISTP